MTDKQGMGFGRFWRMFSEKNRQGLADLGLHSALGDTKPTPMQRAQYMRKEASDFANKIRMCEKDIRGLKLANESFLKTCKSVLSSPLPRLYEVNQEGAVLPVGEIDSIGRGCNVEDVERVSDELSAGLEADVLTPMKQWLFAWSTVQGRLKDLTDKRVEMDSRRRQVANLRRKEEYAKSKVDTASNASVRLKKEQDLEKIWHIQQHKDGKLAAAVASYESMESEVLEELAGLIRDAVCLKSYLAACTEFQREAFRGISTSLIGTAGAQRAALPSSQNTGSAENPFEKKQANDTKKASVSTQYDNGEGSKSNGVKPNSHALYGDDIKLPAPSS